jgi:hypothetical protein
MPTTIYFTGGQHVEVEPDPTEVRTMLGTDRERGEAFSMFDVGDGDAVYVDPTAVAYFKQAREGHAQFV